MCTFVVEDGPADARILIEEFRSVQLDYLLFRSGDELLSFIASRSRNPLFKRPSLILLDINMPGRSGLDILLHLRNDRAFDSTPIAMLTTSRHGEDRERSARLGADRYFVKPMNLEEWESIVQEITQLAKNGRMKVAHPHSTST